MTELEAAYNLGVSDATEALRIAAKAIPSNHSLGESALLGIADTIDGLKIGDPCVEPTPLFPIEVAGGSMKRKALVGFTHIDAMVWLADECRERGCAMMVSRRGRLALIGDDEFHVFRPGETEPDPSKFDEIIERKEIAA